MNYTINFVDDAEKKLKKLSNKKLRDQIIDYVTRLENYDNPRSVGKALQGKFKKLKLWRYRSGNYRLIATIDDKNKVINIIDFNDRKTVYEEIEIDNVVYNDDEDLEEVDELIIEVIN